MGTTPRNPHSPRKFPAEYYRALNDPNDDPLVNVEGFTEWSYYFEELNNEYHRWMGTTPTPEADDKWYDHLGKSLTTIPAMLGGIVGMSVFDTEIPKSRVENIENAKQRALSFIWDQLSDALKFGIYTVVTGIGGVIGLPILSWLNGRILALDPMERPPLNPRNRTVAFNPVFTKEDVPLNPYFLTPIQMFDPIYNPRLQPVFSSGQKFFWQEGPIIFDSLDVLQQSLNWTDIKTWTIGGISYSSDFGPVLP